MRFLIEITFFGGILTYITGLLISSEKVRKIIQHSWYIVSEKNEPINRENSIKSLLYFHEAVYENESKLSIKKFFTIIILLNISFFLGMILWSVDYNSSFNKLKTDLLISFFVGMLISVSISEFISYKITKYMLIKYNEKKLTRYLLYDLILLIILYVTPIIFLLMSLRTLGIDLQDDLLNTVLGTITWSSFAGNVMPAFFMIETFQKGYYFEFSLILLPALSIGFPSALWISSKSIFSNKLLLQLVAGLFEYLSTLNAGNIKSTGLIVFTLSTGLISYISYHNG